MCAELLRRHGIIHNELTRKFVHIAHALVVVGWVYTANNYWVIAIAEMIFLTVVVVSRQKGSMAALRAVDRNTYGELLFPVGVVALCLISPTQAIFTVCMLQLGFSDALAAVVGKRLKSYKYLVFGCSKSIAGTAAFFVSALVIFGSYQITYGTGNVLSVPTLVTASIILAMIENLSPYGTDNVTIPVTAYMLLALGVIS